MAHNMQNNSAVQEGNKIKKFNVRTIMMSSLTYLDGPRLEEIHN